MEMINNNTTKNHGKKIKAIKNSGNSRFFAETLFEKNFEEYISANSKWRGRTRSRKGRVKGRLFQGVATDKAT